MTITGFVFIPEIEGAATLAGHQGEIAVHAVSWRIGVAEPAAGSSRSRTRSEASTFDVAKFWDRSSPHLASATAEGKRFDEVVFMATAAGVAGDIEDYLTITLSNATVAEYVLGTGDNKLLETVRFQAAKMEISYSLFDDHGVASGDEAVEISLRDKRPTRNQH